MIKIKIIIIIAIFKILRLANSLVFVSIINVIILNNMQKSLI